MHLVNMQTIQAVIQSYPTKAALACGALCAAGAAEMALRVFKDMSEANVDNLSKDLAGALFYGICAANAIPYTPVIGAVIFTGWTLWSYKSPDAYLTMKLYGNIIEAAFRALKFICEWTIVPFFDHAVAPIWNHIVVPFWNKVITPLAQELMRAAAAVFKVINLPSNPAWYGVAALVAGIAIYNALPHLPFSIQSPVVWQFQQPIIWK